MCVSNLDLIPGNFKGCGLVFLLLIPFEFNKLRGLTPITYELYLKAGLISSFFLFLFFFFSCFSFSFSFL